MVRPALRAPRGSKRMMDRVNASGARVSFTAVTTFVVIAKHTKLALGHLFILAEAGKKKRPLNGLFPEYIYSFSLRFNVLERQQVHHGHSDEHQGGQRKCRETQHNLVRRALDEGVHDPQQYVNPGQGHQCSATVSRQR